VTTESSVLDVFRFPSDWNQSKFRWVIENRKVLTIDDLPLLGANLVLGVTERFEGDGRPAASEDLSKYKVVEPDDVIMNPLGKPHGSIGRSSVKGITSPAYWVLRGNPEVLDPRYLHYLLRSDVLINEYKRRSKNLPPNQFDLPWEQFRDFEFPLPPIEEQRRIADYLDDVSAKLRTSAEAIDQIVASLNNLYRGIAFDSLVAEVNFDPKLGFTVKAKNESWKQFPLHQVCAEVKNKIVGGGEDNLLSLSYGRIIRRSIESAEGLLPESFDGYNIIEQGDIVLRLTDLQNDQTSLRVGMSTEKGIITSAYTTIRPNGILPKFLGYQLKAFDAAKFFYALGGGLRQSMKYADLKNFRVMVPSLSEQEVIVADLDVRSAKILQLIQDFRAMKILVLEELSSLITAAVTGQFNVTTGRSVA